MNAETISSKKRIVQVACSVLWCFTTAGVVFGFAALKPVLIKEGVYSQFCQDGALYCEDSDTRMNFMFTIATVVTNGCALPAGYILDRIGPQKTTIIGAIIFLLGNIVFGMQTINKVFDTYLIGYCLIALGSVAMFLSQFHLSNAFPKYSGVILAAITGAFDASSVPYLIYREVYIKLGGRPDLRTFFWMYSVFPVAIIIQQLIAGPTQIYTRAAPQSDTIEAFDTEDFDDLARARSPPQTTFFASTRDDPIASGFSRVSYPTPAMGVYGDDEEEEAKVLDGGKGDGVVGAMFRADLREQLTSSWFWIICLYLFVAMIRTNWYLATVQSQLEWYTKDDVLADTLTRAFTVLLPLAGIVGIPIVGILIDHQTTMTNSLVLIVLGIAFGILTLIPKTVPQLLGIGVLVFNRPLLYTFVSDVFAKVFGFANFGKVYGLAMTLSGVIGLVLTPMDIMTKGVFHGDFTPINVLLLVLGAITNIALIARIWFHTRKGRVALRDVDE